MSTLGRQEFRAPDDDLGVLAGSMGISAVLSGGKAEPTTGAAPPAREERPKARKAPRHTYNVADEVHRQAVNAVDFLSGPPEREQLGKLVERAIIAEVKRLEIARNGGQPFPLAQAPLRTGKRPGA